MKKKIIISLFIICLFSVFTLKVQAYDSVLNISNEIKAKAPSDESIPNINDTVYATIADKFDYSKVIFEGTDGSEINGIDDLRKIIVSKTLNYQISDLSLSKVLGENWFTAYCLDGELNFPQYGTYTSSYFLTALNNYRAASNATAKKEALEKALKQAVRGALVNDTSVQNILKEAKNYPIGPEVEYSLAYEGDNAIDNYFVIDGDNVALKDEELLVYVKEVKFTNLDLQQKIFSGEQLAQGGQTALVDEVVAYPLKIKASDVAFDKYTASNLGIENYEQSLWILEHSYPTISLDDTIKLVGANETTLINEIKALEAEKGNTVTTEKERDYLENYVYGTIQYAIWKVNNGKPNLGNKIKNSTQLSLIYEFYIKDRSEYSGYSKLTNKASINISAPASGKELYKTTDSTYLYGPYSAKFTGVMAADSNSDLKLSIANSDKTGLKIVNESGTEINKVSPDAKFYIEVAKTAQVGSVKFEVSVEANVFSQDNNRGRIYNPKFVLAQNVMSGGQIVKKTVNNSLTITVNAKTGVENVAVILMVTLVAFSLGYLVLSYKGKGSLLR